MRSEEEIEQLAEQALRKIEESTSLCANSSEEYIFIVGYVSGFKSQFREPSTQGGEEQLDGLLKSQLRELAERRKKDYDRLADSFERLKQENDGLAIKKSEHEASLNRIQVLEEALREAKFVISEHQSVITASTQVLKEIDQALNHKD